MMTKTLTEKIRKKQPMVGAAVGSGMSAKAAEEGGADFLLVLSGGYYRMQGCSSMAALLPYANANRLTLEMMVSGVLPRIKGIPVFVGICAQDPDIKMKEFLISLKQLGVHGVTNFPSVGFIDGQYREALEENGMGFDKEPQVLTLAKELGLLTVGFCFTPNEAVSMARAKVDILNMDLGFAEWRQVQKSDREEMLDLATIKINDILKKVNKVSKKIYTTVYGGPVTLPRDTALVYRQTNTCGYIGGSTIERFPAAPIIRQTVQEFAAVAHSKRHTDRLGAMIGRSESLQKVYEMICRAADSDAPVLLVGESGTGKELAAREIHRRSQRNSKPLVTWNCGAISESLALSELFGHERGSFTGATTKHTGKFEQADKATLFMDELADLPPNVQSSLLRALQEREIVRLGGSKSIPVDVRLMAATNKDLPQLVKSKEFRLDLYYRLSTLVIRIPPLRERLDDLPFLVWELTRELCHRYNCPTPQISDTFFEALYQHSWPGNVRELRNAVERCIILGRGEAFQVDWLEEMFELAYVLEGSDQLNRPRLPDSKQMNTDNKTPQDRLTLVENSLKRHGGNKSAVARELGITRKTLYTWIRES